MKQACQTGTCRALGFGQIRFCYLSIFTVILSECESKPCCSWHFLPRLESSYVCSVVNRTVVVFLCRLCLSDKQQGAEIRVDHIITIKVNVPGLYLM